MPSHSERQLEQIRKWMKAHYRKRRKSGACPICLGPRDGGERYVLCSTCRQKRREAWRKREAQRHAQQVGDTATDWSTLSSKQRYALLKARGLCPRCGALRLGAQFVHCFDCRKTAADHRERRKATRSAA